MSSAAAVFAAVEAGLLPDVLDYACSGTAEWIEFAVPGVHQATLQQQEWLRCLQHSDSSCRQMKTGLPLLSPVIWFRFLPSPAAAAAADADAAEADADEDDDDDNVGLDVWFDVFHDQQQQELEEVEEADLELEEVEEAELEAQQELGQQQQQQQQQEEEAHSASSPLQDVEPSAVSNDCPEGHQQDVSAGQQAPAPGAQAPEVQGVPAAAAAAGDAAVSAQAGVAGAVPLAAAGYTPPSASSASSSSMPLPSLPGGRAAVVPRRVQEPVLCSEAPDLPSTATEVSQQTAAAAWLAGVAADLPEKVESCENGRYADTEAI
jgi:hypothetical protein